MSTVRATLRPVTLADVERVARLLREADDLKVRSEAGWRWLFNDNPAHRRLRAPPAMGWVLERAGRLEGYLGNIRLDYVLDGRALRAATCTSYYVRPAARGESARLMSAFFRQPDVDLFVTTTANAASAPVYRLFKAQVPQDACFAEKYAWVVDDRLALEGELARRGLAPPLTRTLAGVASPLARLLRGMSGIATAPPGPAACEVLELEPAALDERFDHLWLALSQRPGLQVRRDAAALRWYFGDPDAGGTPAIFACPGGDGLDGYAAAALHRPAGAEAPQLRVLDIAVRDGREGAIAALLQRILAHARKSGAGLVYCAPCGATLAAHLRALRPYTRRHAHATHFLRAGKGVGADLARPGLWHATGLDGDRPFCIEHAPAR